MGPELRDEGLKNYFNQWAFKHPGVNDFKRVMETTSDLELDWYFQYFVNTTHTIDYSVASVLNDGDTIAVELERIGGMPMPIDVMVEFADGDSAQYHIPLVMMRGHRPLAPNEQLAEDWAWVQPSYVLRLPTSGRSVARVEIDPMRYLADVDRQNNSATLCANCIQSFERD